MADEGTPLERMSSQDRRVAVIAEQLDKIEAKLALALTGTAGEAPAIATADEARAAHAYRLTEGRKRHTRFSWRIDHHGFPATSTRGRFTIRVEQGRLIV